MPMEMTLPTWSPSRRGQRADHRAPQQHRDQDLRASSRFSADITTESGATATENFRAISATLWLEEFDASSDSVARLIERRRGQQDVELGRRWQAPATVRSSVRPTAGSEVRGVQVQNAG